MNTIETCCEDDRILIGHRYIVTVVEILEDAVLLSVEDREEPEKTSLHLLGISEADRLIEEASAEEESCLQYH